MAGGEILDLVLLVAVALFALSGFRQGFIVGVLSFVGVIGGGLFGAAVAPAIADRLGTVLSPPLTGILVVFLFASLGQVIAAAVGAAIRRVVSRGPLRLLDSSAGAILSAVAVLGVAWFLGSAIVASSFTTAANAVRSSSVLAAVDTVVPTPARTAFSAFRRLIDDNNFARVFDGITTPTTPEVPPADPALANSGPVAEAASRIAKITGVATACSRRVEGSGFVYAPERVLTNAHVVAGVERPTVAVGGRQLPARVVAFDPRRDVAVLFVPGLNLPPLALAERQAARGAQGVVIGYPLDGPLRAVAARVRGVLNARGPDIYQREIVTREVYSLRGQVLPGNSGGPLLSQDGTVAGVVFAAAVGDDNTGYALTAAEVAPVAAAGKTAVTPVGTGGCD